MALANNSGGPKTDIVVPFNGKPTGFLASTAVEYAEKLCTIFEMAESEAEALKRNAREHILRGFSSDAFERDFLKCLARNVE